MGVVIGMDLEVIIMFLNSSERLLVVKFGIFMFDLEGVGDYFFFFGVCVSFMVFVFVYYFLI